MKVVINDDWGSFGLSEEAVEKRGESTRWSSRIDGAALSKQYH
jgi:hypothetical protein